MTELKTKLTPPNGMIDLSGMTGTSTYNILPQPTTVEVIEEPLTSGFNSSSKLDLLAGALAAAQSQFETVGKNSVNPHFKSKYADLASLINATAKGLAVNGLVVIQNPIQHGNRVNVISRLLHKSGQWIENSVSLKPATDTPQAVGSTITYGRRYGLAALLGICADEDDDGNAGSKR